MVAQTGSLPPPPQSAIDVSELRRFWLPTLKIMGAVRDREALGLGPLKPELRMVKGHDDPVEVYRLV